MKRSPLSQNWLVHSLVEPMLERAVTRYASGELLDIGCGDKPYAEMVKPHVKTHVGLDHAETQHNLSHADLVGTAYSIPVPDCRFDTVLCTYVLEHVEEPSRAVAEACRVLKPGGYAIYTVPLYWHLHEAPRDFYRFTQFGLNYLFEQNGFEIVELVPLCGFIATFTQELTYFLFRMRKGGRLNPLWWIVPPVGAVLQCLAWLVTRWDHSYSFTMEYLLVARKPAVEAR